MGSSIRDKKTVPNKSPFFLLFAFFSLFFLLVGFFLVFISCLLRFEDFVFIVDSQTNVCVIIKFVMDMTQTRGIAAF